MSAVEFRNLPEKIQFLEGRVTLPDGKALEISKREDFLVRKVVSSANGTVKEGVLIPPGVTGNCVLELRWRVATERGEGALQGRGWLQYMSPLPTSCGSFHYWTLGSSLPTQKCVVQMSKEADWPFHLLSGKDFYMEEGAGAKGRTFTFRNLPAVPEVPFSLPIKCPSPKLVIYRPIEEVAYLTGNAPAIAYWSKVGELFYKPWFMVKVRRSSDFKKFSMEIRKDLTGTPHERALAIAERALKRVRNIDQLAYDEKLPFGAGYQVELDGYSDLDFAARSGFADRKGMPKLLFHLLADEGLAPSIALVSDRYDWAVMPEVRSPFQFDKLLIGVADPKKGILWMDPTNRYLQPGQIPEEFTGSRIVVLETPDWKAGLQDLMPSPASANTRNFTYQLDAQEEECSVKIAASLTGAKALSVREALGPMSPSKREAYLKELFERNNFIISRCELSDTLDATRPLTYTLEGTQPLEQGRNLRIRPFPGLNAGIYLPDNLANTRQDPIVMPCQSTQEATCTVHVPPGYLLPQEILFSHSNQWGRVFFRAHQEPGGGDIAVNLTIKTQGFFSGPDGYQALKNYLEWVRTAIHLDINLEKGPTGNS